MYDLLTSTLLVLLLTPGILVTLPPGGSILTVAIVHAIVFYVIQTFLARLVPWWGVWIAVAVVVGARFFMPTTTSTF
jgi:hypothetical protein